MKCSKAEKHITDYIDDLLDAGERAEFKKHIESCPKCRAKTEELLNIMKDLKQTNRHEVPATFFTGLDKKLDKAQEKKKKGFVFEWNNMMKVTATGFAVVMTLVLVTQIKNNPEFFRLSGAKTYDEAQESLKSRAPSVNEAGEKVKDKSITENKELVVRYKNEDGLVTEKKLEITQPGVYSEGACAGAKASRKSQVSSPKKKMRSADSAMLTEKMAAPAAESPSTFAGTKQDNLKSAPAPAMMAEEFSDMDASEAEIKNSADIIIIRSRNEAEKKGIVIKENVNFEDSMVICLIGYNNTNNTGSLDIVSMKSFEKMIVMSYKETYKGSSGRYSVNGRPYDIRVVPASDKRIIAVRK